MCPRYQADQRHVHEGRLDLTGLEQPVLMVQTLTGNKLYTFKLGQNVSTFLHVKNPEKCGILEKRNILDNPQQNSLEAKGRRGLPVIDHTELMDPVMDQTELMDPVMHQTELMDPVMDQTEPWNLKDQGHEGSKVEQEACLDGEDVFSFTSDGAPEGNTHSSSSHSGSD